MESTHFSHLSHSDFSSRKGKLNGYTYHQYNASLHNPILGCYSGLRLYASPRCGRELACLVADHPYPDCTSACLCYFDLADTQLPSFETSLDVFSARSGTERRLTPLPKAQFVNLVLAEQSRWLAGFCLLGTAQHCTSVLF